MKPEVVVKIDKDKKANGLRLNEIRAYPQDHPKSAGAAAPAAAGDLSGLTPEQLLQFAEWIKANPNVNTMIQFQLPVAAAEGTNDAQRYRLLLSCEHCSLLHSSDLPWCPASLGMAAQAPLMGPPGTCDLSKHERHFELWP